MIKCESVKNIFRKFSEKKDAFEKVAENSRKRRRHIFSTRSRENSLLVTIPKNFWSPWRKKFWGTIGTLEIVPRRF